MRNIFQSICQIMSEYCSLCLAGIRVLCYQLYKIICCIKTKPPTPEFNVLCLGLTRSGKSTALSVLAHEKGEIQPTFGFSIKAVHLSNCILNVKEIGGGEQVRPYWSRYFQHAQGLVFALDGAADSLDVEREELRKAYSHTALSGLPILLLITHADLAACRTCDEVVDLLSLSDLVHPDCLIVHSCSSEDYETLRHGFIRFGGLLCPPPS